MRLKDRFSVIHGDKPAPLVTRQDILFGARVFAAVFAAILTIPYWSTLKSVFPSVSEEFATMAAQRPNVRVIDGDTIEDRASGTRYRLTNIDTPESGNRAKCSAERQLASQATAAVNRLVARSQSLRFLSTGDTDRYGRTLAHVELDGRDLGVTLIDLNLARPWRGRREPWCDRHGELIP